MTEIALRNLIVATARSYLGSREGSAKHHEIVDAYNSHKPLARGYALKYTDDWCAGFVGAMAVMCTLEAIIPMEVSVPKMIGLAQAMGIWVENDAYIPQEGDILIYYWGDNGAGDCTTGADHVGIVECSLDGKINVIEGNMADQVGRRIISVNGRYIRGFICPNYAALADEVAGFVDVAPEAWYADAVRWAVKHGITSGVDDTHFAPNDTCTRAQAVTMLWRLYVSPEPDGEYRAFTDVQPAAWYAKAVQWAVEKGITNGVGDGKFQPDEPCTRAQIVTFLWRAEGRPEGAFMYAPFDDVDPTAWYCEAVAWAYGAGIVQGTGDYAFSPDDPCTRAQTVTFLMRMAEA